MRPLILLLLFVAAIFATKIGQNDHDYFYDEEEDIDVDDSTENLLEKYGNDVPVATVRHPEQEVDALLSLAYQTNRRPRLSQESRWMQEADMDHLVALANVNNKALRKQKMQQRLVEEEEEESLGSEAYKTEPALTSAIDGWNENRAEYVTAKEELGNLRYHIRRVQQAYQANEEQLQNVQRVLDVKKQQIGHLQAIADKFTEKGLKPPYDVVQMERSDKQELQRMMRYSGVLADRGDHLKDMVDQGPKKLKKALEHEIDAREQVLTSKKKTHNLRKAVKTYAAKLKMDADQIRLELIPAVDAVISMGKIGLRKRIARLLAKANAAPPDSVQRLQLQTKARRYMELGRIAFGKLGSVVIRHDYEFDQPSKQVQKVAAAAHKATIAAHKAKAHAAKAIKAAKAKASQPAGKFGSVPPSVDERYAIRNLIAKQGLQATRRRLLSFIRKMTSVSPFQRFMLRSSALEIVNMARSIWGKSFGSLSYFARLGIANNNVRLLRTKAVATVKAKGPKWTQNQVSRLQKKQRSGSVIGRWVAGRQQHILRQIARRLFPGAATRKRGQGPLGFLKSKAIEQVAKGKVKLLEARIVAVKAKLAKAGALSKFFLEGEIHELLQLGAAAFGKGFDVSAADIDGQGNTVHQVRSGAVSFIQNKGEEFALRILKHLMFKSKKASYLRRYILAQKALRVVNLVSTIWKRPPSIQGFVFASIFGPAAKKLGKSTNNVDAIERKAAIYVKKMGLEWLKKEIVDVQNRLSAAYVGPLSRYFLEGEAHLLLSLGHDVFAAAFEVSASDLDAHRQVVAEAEAATESFLSSKGQGFTLRLLRNLLFKGKKASCLKRYILDEKARWLVSFYKNIWRKAPSVSRLVVDNIAGRRQQQQNNKNKQSKKKSLSMSGYLKKQGPNGTRRIVSRLISAARGARPLTRMALLAVSLRVVQRGSRLFGRFFNGSLTHLIRAVAQGKSTTATATATTNKTKKGASKLSSRVQRVIASKGKKWYTRVVRFLASRAHKAAPINRYLIHVQAAALAQLGAGVKFGTKYPTTQSKKQKKAAKTSAGANKRQSGPLCVDELKDMAAAYDKRQGIRRKKMNTVQFCLDKIARMRMIKDLEVDHSEDDEGFAAALATLNINQNTVGSTATPASIKKILLKLANKLVAASRKDRQLLEQKKKECGSSCDLVIDEYTERLVSAVKQRKHAKMYVKRLALKVNFLRGQLMATTRMHTVGKKPKKLAQVRQDLAFLHRLNTYTQQIAAGKQVAANPKFAVELENLSTREPAAKQILLEMMQDTPNVAAISSMTENLQLRLTVSKKKMEASGDRVAATKRMLAITRAHLKIAKNAVKDASAAFNKLRSVAQRVQRQCAALVA